MTASDSVCQCCASCLWNVLRADDGKVEIRRRVWDYLDENHLALFPRPPHRRISNFRVSILCHSFYRFTCVDTCSVTLMHCSHYSGIVDVVQLFCLGQRHLVTLVFNRVPHQSTFILPV